MDIKPELNPSKGFFPKADLLGLRKHRPHQAIVDKYDPRRDIHPQDHRGDSISVLGSRRRVSKVRYVSYLGTFRDNG